MQNVGPDSPRVLRPAFTRLALTLLLAASPAAADETTPAAVSPGAATGPAGFVVAAPPLRPRRPVWPTVLAFRRQGAAGERWPPPVGLAFRITEGMSLGAGGGFDPVSGEILGLIALDIRF